MKWVLFFIVLIEVPLMAETIKGQVISVQKVNFAAEPSPHLQFILRTQQGEYVVEAGPEWYLNYQGVRLFTGVTIAVDGTVEEIEGRKIIHAESITINNTNIPLPSTHKKGY